MIQKQPLEDTTSQAGWMFADLFLALTVIFLATVSFIPSGSSKADDTTNSQTSTFTTFKSFNGNLVLISNGFIGKYKANSTSKFIKDLNDYLKTKDIPASTSVLYFEVVGHSNNEREGNDLGNLDALKFVIELRKLKPLMFEGTNTSINLGPEVPPGYVRVKLTFS